MVALATSSGLTAADLNMAAMALSMPTLGFVVVGALCHARMPLSELMTGGIEDDAVGIGASDIDADAKAS